MLFLGTVQEWVMSRPPEFWLVAVIGGLFALCVRDEYLLRRGRKENIMLINRLRDIMAARGRTRVLKTHITTGITDFMEELFNEGKISLEEKQEWYARFARSCGLTDLQPKVLQKKSWLVKADIAERRAMNGHDPVPLPDATREEKKLGNLFS